MSDRMNRRDFLQTTAALAAAATIRPTLAQTKAAGSAPYPENGTLIPDEGWHLWLDREANWQEDDIFLPEDVHWVDGALHGGKQPLPVNAPTGGWSALTSGAGKTVVLPTTVEQHFWGVAGSRPYTPEEYRYAAPATGGVAPADDNIPQNGAYIGVSWWYRNIDIPASMQGKRIFLHIRGARLRAEVYLNGKLCGYSIMEELPFESDLTAATNPGGENHLAIRLTNPFGRFDWVDGLNAKWGEVSLYRSHGFAGLDCGITISAHHNDLRIKNIWILNRPEPRVIYVRAEFEGASQGGAWIKTLDFQIVDAENGKTVYADSVAMDMEGATCCDGTVDPKTGKYPATRTSAGEFPLTCKSAELWTLDDPHLYHLKATIRAKDGRTDTRTIAFGFRSFTPDGLGANALFRLNGRRIKIYTSISWGFWGLNGLFPVPELAEKEVTQAKKFGLNCLNFHRNLAKEEVLRAHDRLGLLRYMEPGAGKMAIGKLPAAAEANAANIVMEKPTSAAEKFAQRYMFVKCVEMVKAYRSHPSVIEYCLQNEIGADLKNPDTIAILEAMRAEDPSRCIVLNDGFVAPPRKAAQAWFEPWNPKLHRSDEEPWGGWWNQHQGAGDQWYDEFYKSPTDFTYKSPVRAQISEFGEMEGCATPDNHSLMIHQITDTYKRYGGTSYDLQDHEDIVAGANKFLDKWGFRKAFPATEQLWLSIGKKCYETWQNYLENARISDELDFAAISGWESTAIENHSGIVDNLRNFKSDPTPISQTLQPVLPVAKQRSLCAEFGKSAMFDLYLLNDTSAPATGTLTFSMLTPTGHRQDLVTLSSPEHVPDQFSYLLKTAFETPPLTEEGLYRFKFSLSSAPLSTHTKDIWVTQKIALSSSFAAPHARYVNQVTLAVMNVAVSGISPGLRKQLSTLVGVIVREFQPGEKYDLIISSGLTSHTAGEAEAGETTGLEAVPPPMKPGHTPEPGEEPIPQQLGHLQHGILEAVRAGTPLLAIPQANALSDGVAKQLADAGAFTFNGNVGDFRAPWMGNWYFVREHALFAGMPVNQALGGFYQAKGRQSNGLLVDGPAVEIIVAYSRDHDRKIGAGTFTTTLGQGKILYHRCPDFHPVLQQRFLANALRWLTS
jgi:beta-galactosidase